MKPTHLCYPPLAAESITLKRSLNQAMVESPDREEREEDEPSTKRICLLPTFSIGLSSKQVMQWLPRPYHPVLPNRLFKSLTLPPIQDPTHPVHMNQDVTNQKQDKTDKQVESFNSVDRERDYEATTWKIPDYKHHATCFGDLNHKGSNVLGDKYCSPSSDGKQSSPTRNQATHKDQDYYSALHQNFGQARILVSPPHLQMSQLNNQILAEQLPDQYQDPSGDQFTCLVQQNHRMRPMKHQSDIVHKTVISNQPLPSLLHESPNPSELPDLIFPQQSLELPFDKSLDQRNQVFHQQFIQFDIPCNQSDKPLNQPPDQQVSRQPSTKLVSLPFLSPRQSRLDVHLDSSTCSINCHTSQQKSLAIEQQLYDNPLPGQESHQNQLHLSHFHTYQIHQQPQRFQQTHLSEQKLDDLSFLKQRHQSQSYQLDRKKQVQLSGQESHQHQLHLSHFHTYQTHQQPQRLQQTQHDQQNKHTFQHSREQNSVFQHPDLSTQPQTRPQIQVQQSCQQICCVQTTSSTIKSPLTRSGKKGSQKIKTWKKLQFESANSWLQTETSLNNPFINSEKMYRSNK
eukprot:TRINITY_DN22598_c0_g1_i1.p1 TRINITY_DN22598_c0_g1~~TRINITY_DN22598_c0_g1_i1.p1  ORF type:complete len:594 (-),score=86.47 TRINITY_DN22598_c0_g1_i1:153-1859(-)